MIKHTFDAGVYYIGDPCYAVANDKWDKLIEETGCFGVEGYGDKPATNWQDGIFFYNGFKCFAGGTAFGDGEYRCGNRVYGVDAGLLSIMPLMAIDTIPVINEKGYSDFISPSHAVTFNNKKLHGVSIEVYQSKFQVWRTEKGRFHFGIIQIDTQ